jgi:Flp pilus assembly protein TadG
MDIKTRASRSACCRHGAAAIELAAVFPLIVMLLLGLMEVGRLIEVQQILTNAVREGGRQASTGRRSNSEVAQVVRDYLKNAGLSTSNVVVTVGNLGAPGVDSTNASQLDRLQVKVTIPYNDIRLANAKLITVPSTTLVATVVWYSLRDRPYAPPPEPPIE